jgi:hypothetical protein
MPNLSRFAALRSRAVLRRPIVVAIALALFGLMGVGSALAVPPHRVLSNEVLRDSDSMSVAQIQAYLNKQPGPLKKLRTWDHDTTCTVSASQPNVNLTPDADRVSQSAAQLIWDACQQWQINPKVMLTMLQKEQSLLTRTKLTSTTLSRAIGAGCPNGTTNKYPGFGNQMWYGAKLLDGYGEGKNNSKIALFYPGIRTWDIYRHPNIAIFPWSLATYKLYVYNPSISGNTSFWNIYTSRFGNPVWPAVTKYTSTRLYGPSSVKAKKTLRLTGKVSYSASGYVTISKSRLVGRKWKSAGTVKVPVVRGSYRYSSRPGSHGSWRITARYSGIENPTTTWTSSRSSVKSVRVK